MKFIYLASACLTLIVSTSHAQLVIKPALGINFTDFSKDPGTGEYKSKVGYQVGGSVEIGQKLYFEPGLYWTHKSTEYTTTSSSGQNIDYNMSGIRIPLTVGYSILGGTKSLVNVRALGGFSGFFLTSISDLDKDAFNTATWGLYAGAGVDIMMFYMDFQYEWSLSKVGDDVTVADVGKTRSLFINAGIRFRL
ncbi:outer membrane beta-barrel protein [Paraflavitalea sp. CAU 1676]|uniref:outer membrane beta-barrel protein n=1 Tax=Paraflavitalea sp. CAU 1676 TaxID=3032598 RepID=UPI0023DB7CD2|nr:outer membrane beta-barrel protein [Paraflavitalea sp. CAU 1676]MDF2191438.1 outer membrane beta-barrel protein [Paraflavitalea sp. CAU 1676]